jgi:regulator of protease activity HflC (stomatin/prohibitin superfamily)
VISAFAVMEIYSSNRARIREEIRLTIKAQPERDGFRIDRIVLHDVPPTPEFARAIATINEALRMNRTPSATSASSSSRTGSR